MKAILLLVLLVSLPLYGQSSTCMGTTSNGKLINGVQLPHSGSNFIGYSSVLRLAGRTYVHSGVKDIVVEVYRRLESEQPGKVFKYGETGFKNGGVFKPHKTHQNGLSVDFFTPMLTSDGKSVHLPTHLFNKYGYNIEFDDQGAYKGWSIDYEAMASHITLLHKVSVESGLGLWRVIFDPALQAGLFRTKNGEYLKKHIRFSKRRSWVRHDDHYHVDFEIPCQ